MTDGKSSVLPITNVHAMPFIYRGHQGPVPKGHLDWKWLNKMFSLHTICFFRQDDGDAGDDGRASRISEGLVDFYIY